MGSPHVRDLQQALVFAAVLLLHALGVTLVLELRRAPALTAPHDFFSTVTLLPARPVPAGARNELNSVASVPLPPPPPPSPGEISRPDTGPAATDWTSQAREAAAAVTVPPTVRGFGTNPGAESAAAHPQPAHVPGEQYRTTDGAWVVWVSEHCYLVSEIPPAGVPEVVARSFPMKTQCQGDAPSRGDLFKDLPAYERYHPH